MSERIVLRLDVTRDDIDDALNQRRWHLMNLVPATVSHPSQMLVLTEDRLWNYESKYRGEETMDGVDCWVLQVRPRQILQGQRFFDGMLWVDKNEYNIVRMEGQAVPQIRSTKSENLFPRFTTIRKPLDGKHWFPIYTYADDTLQFRTGPQRIRLRIAYSTYKKFGAESTLIVK